MPAPRTGRWHQATEVGLTEAPPNMIERLTV